MGVIQRQSIKYSIVNIVGLGIGTLSTLFVYPHVLEENGLMRFLLDAGVVLLPVLCLGANTIAIRFFPKFENRDNGNNGFLSLLLLLILSGGILLLLASWLLWPVISDYYRVKSPLLHGYLPFAVPVIFFYVLNQVLFTYSVNYKRIVVPSLLSEFSQKLVLPALLIAVWQQWISLDTALYGLVAHGFMVSVGLVVYLRWLGVGRLADFRGFVKPDLRNDMLRYGAFGVLSGFALLVAAKSDLLMVGSLDTLQAAGVYAIASQIALVIEAPIKGLYSASISTVARHIAENDLVALGDIYKKVSINLLAAGLLLFLSIWISLDSLFQILPNSEAVAAGKWVFFFIGLSRIIEMTTGLNNGIIYYSKYYAWSLLSLGISAIAVFLLNLWLIPHLGISGAAISTCLSIAAYNSFTVFLVWRRFGLLPFSKETLPMIALGLAVYGLSFFIPKTGWHWLDIVVRSGAFSLLFAFGVYRLNFLPDLNEFVLKNYKNLSRR